MHQTFISFAITIPLYRIGQIFSIKVVSTNPSTGGKIQFIFYWNWMMTVFSLHISTTLHLTIFGIWGNNIQSVQYVICVMIVRGLWYIGLAIRYTIMLRIYVHHGAPFCILTVKRHCLPFSPWARSMKIVHRYHFRWQIPPYIFWKVRLSAFWKSLGAMSKR